jgi:hypothetical protein
MLGPAIGAAARRMAIGLQALSRIALAPDGRFRVPGCVVLGAAAGLGWRPFCFSAGWLLAAGTFGSLLAIIARRPTVDGAGRVGAHGGTSAGT